jgi:PAS domain S-box-containing protein
MSSVLPSGLKRFLPTLLVTRITLATAAVIVVALAFNVFYGQYVFKESLRQQQMEQQRAAVAIVASKIDDSIRERFAALEATAATFDAAAMANTVVAQRQLTDKPALQTLFNRGTFIAGVDGTAIASVPASAQRVGVNYADRDFMINALQEGRSSMARPALGKVLGSPVLVMAAPIRDATGKPIGALMGATDLGKPNFLDSLVAARYGRTGSYLLVAPQYRQIVTAGDKRRMMELLPPRGQNPALDRFVDGYEGSSFHRSPTGVEVMSSVKRVASVGWYVAAQLPTAEAFEPARETGTQIVVGGIAMILLAVGMAWLVVRRQLAPLSDTVEKLSKQAEVDAPPIPLPVVRPDEVGNMMNAFNRLIERVASREEAQRASERHQREIINASPVPMRLNDAAGNITFVNTAFTDTFGYRVEDIPTIAAWWARAYPDQKYHEATLREWEARIKASETTGLPFEPLEIDVRCKDGSVRTCLSGRASMPAEYAGDAIVVLYDVTERAKAQRAVRESEEFSLAVLDSLTQNIAVVNERGEIVAVNAAWKRYALAGGADDRVVNPIGTNYVDICRSAAEDPDAVGAKEVLDGLLAVLAGGRSTFMFEYPCPEPHGISWYQISITPLRGSRRGAAIAHKDITDARNAEATRQALEAQLRESQKIEAIGTLAGGISHDFNNILAAILGNTDLARADAADNAPVKQSLDEIRKAAMRGRELVQQILSFSRRQPTAKKPLDLVSVAQDSVRLLRAILPGRVQLKLVADGVKATILADRTQIQQVIVNLVTNAAHAMGAKDGIIQVRVARTRLDHQQIRLQPKLTDLWNRGVRDVAMIEVIDSGAGMDLATQTRIFEPFFTTKPVGEGTGLGLAVVDGIVKRLGGAITVYSELGRGCAFQLYFPASATDAVISVDPTSPVRRGGSNQRVLYIDDEEALVLIGQAMLQRLGYRVDGYTDAGQALAAFEADPAGFAALISDFNMPGTSGLELAAKVLRLRPDLPVAVASGLVTDDLLAQAQALGVREVIYKPHSLDDLAAALNRMMASTP